MKKRNSSIELLRIIFCIMIVNYHFYSHCLRYLDTQKYFTRGYLGDEFFFIITGVFLASSAMRFEGKPIDGTIKDIKKRIIKAAFPYYMTWLLCFLGRNAAKILLHGDLKGFLGNLANSIFELLFIDMFGFRKGAYSNVLAWFFSAMLISILIIGPWIYKYKKTYIFYAAPIITGLGYGILSINFDYLHSPHDLIPNTFILKGLVRAFAGINLGVFAYGVSSNCKIASVRNKRLVNVARFILLLLILIYTTYPFISNYEETTVQWDYIITLCIAGTVILTLLLHNESYGFVNDTINKFGKFSYYVFFGQAIFYSIDRIIYSSLLPLICKYIVTILCIIIASMGLQLGDRVIKNRVKVLQE